MKMFTATIVAVFEVDMAADSQTEAENAIKDMYFPMVDIAFYEIDELVTPTMFIHTLEETGEEIE